MSNNTYYNIYLNNNIELARSMIIKLNIVATAMNKELREYGVEVSEDKSTWRYYKHLAGNYHPFDAKMRIKSLDTGEIIIYNKDNLTHHKKTRSLYKSDQSYTDDLCSLYPSQANLIKGILYPIDIATALNSKDGTILYYDENFVEGHEYNLTYDIESWIRSYLYRASMQSYDESDDLFAASVCGLLYCNLTQAIMDIRSKYVKTAQAHTFHISSYLASYNRLDEFMPYLTYEQKLFLYMNIDYIVRHTGMSETFDILLDKLLTLRNLPVFDYTIRQSKLPIAENNLYPTPVFIKNKLNLDLGLTSRSLDVFDIKTIVHKEAYQATDNLAMLDKYVSEAETSSKRSSISKLPTKILEVSAIDPEDISPSKLIDIIINEWAYHSSNKTYNNTVEIINPLNGDPLKLSVSNAFTLYLYAYAMGFLGMKLDSIPPYLAHDIAKHKWIPESEYLMLAEHSDYGAWDRDINFFIHSNLELSEPIVLTSDFLDRCILINQYRNTRYQWVENKSRFEDRVTNEIFYNYSYKDVWCDINLDVHADYADFFRSIAINHELIDYEMWKDIAMDCLDKATNFTSSNVITLRDIQASMVKLFKRLSSYTIQFLEEIASNDVAVAKSTIIIPGITTIENSSEVSIQNLKIKPLRAGTNITFAVSHINSPVDSLYVDYDNDIHVDADIGIIANCDFEIISNCNVVLEQSKVLDVSILIKE